MFKLWMYNGNGKRGIGIKCQERITGGYAMDTSHMNQLNPFLLGKENLIFDLSNNFFTFGKNLD